ncbi:MAG: PilZ domain-containing protein [Nitrospirae bacterium]|nr:PilZ domain-containing protein [Nitrospirota bacterium]
MNPKNCWEFWNCADKLKAKCPAFTTDSGRECFDLAKDYCPKTTDEFEHCWECPWYQEIQKERLDNGTLTEKRLSKRFTTRISAEIFEDGSSYLANIEDISQEGFGIQITAVPITEASNFRIMPGSKITVKFKTPERIQISLKCKIKWAHIEQRKEGPVYVFGALVNNPEKRCPT